MSWETIALVTAAVIFLPYYLGPLLVRFTQKMPAQPSFEKLDPADEDAWPEAVAPFFKETLPAMTAEGFSVNVLLLQKDFAPGVTSFLMTFENRATQDLALAAAMYMTVKTEGETKTSLRTAYVEFSTVFEDEVEVNTNNSSEIGVLPLPASKTLAQFPEILAPAELVRIHRSIVERVRPGGRKRFPEDGASERVVAESMRKELRYQLQTGYLYLDAEETWFRPTWKGAFLMTWKLLWPISAVRRSARRREAEKWLRET